MYIRFAINILLDNILIFSSIENKKEFWLLTYTFSGVSPNLKNYYEEFLDYAERGVIQTESFAIRPFLPTGDIWMDEEKVVYELKEEDGVYHRVEIPTPHYKKLLEDWMKFVEVNTKAFSES